MTLRSLRPLDCSTRMIFCALSICLTLSLTTSLARKTERGPLIVPRRAADVSVRARECHAGPNQVGAFAELIVWWIAALVPFRRVAAPGLSLAASATSSLSDLMG